MASGSHGSGSLPTMGAADRNPRFAILGRVVLFIGSHSKGLASIGLMVWLTCIAPGGRSGTPHLLWRE
jgi:hypothetical protein